MYSELEKKNYIHYDRISEHRVGGELLPSTGNNLDTSKRPGIKGLFFFFLLALTRKIFHLSYGTGRV